MTRLAGDTLLGTGAWNREAWRVRELTMRLGRTLDEDEIIHQDVHDLRAMRMRLQRTGVRVEQKHPSGAGH